MPHTHSQSLRSILVIANGEQAQPIFGVANRPGNTEGNEQQNERGVVEREIVRVSAPGGDGKRDLSHARGESAQKIGELCTQREDGDGDHHEDVTPGFESYPSERESADTGQQACDREQEEREQPSRCLPQLAEKRQGVGADAVKSSMTKRKVARVSGKDVPSYRCCCKRQGEDGDGCDRRVAAHQRKDECGREKGEYSQCLDSFHCTVRDPRCHTWRIAARVSKGGETGTGPLLVREFGKSKSAWNGDVRHSATRRVYQAERVITSIRILCHSAWALHPTALLR